LPLADGNVFSGAVPLAVGGVGSENACLAEPYPEALEGRIKLRWETPVPNVAFCTEKK